MKLFQNLRPLVRIATELRRIATVMEYFAMSDAASNNRMFIPANARRRNQKDESELLHTDPLAIQSSREEELLRFLHGGGTLLDQTDAEEVDG